MTHCCVIGCKSNSRKKDSEISFHRLPKKLETRAKWIENIGRHNWNPSINTYICSLHFEKDCINHMLNLPRVKDNCFPTIFPHGIVVHKNEQNKSNINGDLSHQYVIVKNESNSQASTSEEDPLQLERTVLFSTTHNIRWDHTYYSSSNPQQVSTVTNKIKIQQKKIKRLQEKVRRQSKKIFSLQSALTKLKNNKNINDEASSL